MIGIIDAVVIGVLPVWRFGSQQVSDLRDIGRAVAIPIEPIMSDAVLASGQHVDQEPANELSRCQRHGGVAACAFKTVIFNAEGNTARIETDQSAVGNRDTMGVSRQICQYCFGSGEGFLGVDDPVDFAQGFKKTVEVGLVDEVQTIPKEL